MRQHLVVQGFTLLACSRCEFVQVAERPSEEHNNIYDQAYFTHVKYQDEQNLARENKGRLALLRRALPAGKARILEAGCGVGDFAALIAKETNSEIVGVDVAEPAIAIARKNYPELAANFHAAKLEDLDLPLESFDVICSWDVIEHIWDPVETYRRLFKFLKPGGALLLSTPNIGAPFAKLTGRYWPFMTPPEHLGFFSHKSMAWLAEEGLAAQLETWISKGKWTNLGFIVYKLHHMLHWKWLGQLEKALQNSWLGKLPVYVPTGDIQYAIIRK